MTLWGRAGIGVCGFLFALGASGMAARGQALITHSIDWYAGHPAALRNAMIQCNVKNGLIGTQDCRNAIVAAHIVAGQPPQEGGGASQP